MKMSSYDINDDINLERTEDIVTTFSIREDDLSRGGVVVLRGGWVVFMMGS
jgi:hypothetical protein